MEIEATEQPDMETRAEQTAEKANARQVALWCDRVRKAKAHHGDAFDRMKEDMRFARGLQWPGQSKLDDPRYVVNIVQRHLRQREAALYAKNPKAVAQRRRTLDFAQWDGDPDAIQQARMAVQEGQQMAQQAYAQGDVQTFAQIQVAVQQAQALLDDYRKGTQHQGQMDRIADTLETVYEHQIGEQQPPFKASMKHLVRRALTTGVGYTKLGYHRFEEYRPEDVARVTDLTEQVAALKARIAEETDEDGEPSEEDSAELSELQNLLDKVMGEQESYIREGLDFDFPRSTSIIPDPDCYQLDGFLGARWVAQEFLLTPAQVRQVYEKSVNDKFTPYQPDGKEMAKDALADMEPEARDTQTRVLVWEVWDKHMGQTFTVANGCDEFLVEPKTPDVYLERFWPFFPLLFNGLEDEEELFPPSDVRLIRDMQMERNLMRQRLREHRDAARPGYVAAKGRLDSQDKKALENREAHDVVELSGLTEQDDVRRVLQAIPTNPIDPNQYEVGSLDEDVYKTVGTQEAVMGGASGATATETSISESARLSAIGAAVDELDDFLTQLAKYASHLLITEMSADKVKEIAGRGAVWPEWSREQVAKDLWLEVRAGSSGRPNKSAEIQNMERLMPFLLQIPGVKSKWLLEQLVERLDDRLDVNAAFDPAQPAITAANRNAEVSTGDPASDPAQQGGEGGDQTTVEQGDSNMGPRPPAESRNMDPNTR